MWLLKQHIDMLYFVGIDNCSRYCWDPVSTRSGFSRLLAEGLIHTQRGLGTEKERQANNFLDSHCTVGIGESDRSISIELACGLTDRASSLTDGRFARKDRRMDEQTIRIDRTLGCGVGLKITG